MSDDRTDGRRFVDQLDIHGCRRLVDQLDQAAADYLARYDASTDDQVREMLADGCSRDSAEYFRAARDADRPMLVEGMRMTVLGMAYSPQSGRLQ